jgi:hypothetical protein
MLRRMCYRGAKRNAYRIIADGHRGAVRAILLLR